MIYRTIYFCSIAAVSSWELLAVLDQRGDAEDMLYFSEKKS